MSIFAFVGILIANQLCFFLIGKLHERYEWNKLLKTNKLNTYCKWIVKSHE